MKLVPFRDKLIQKLHLEDKPQTRQKPETIRAKGRSENSLDFIEIVRQNVVQYIIDKFEDEPTEEILYRIKKIQQSAAGLVEGHDNKQGNDRSKLSATIVSESSETDYLTEGEESKIQKKLQAKALNQQHPLTDTVASHLQPKADNVEAANDQSASNSGGEGNQCDAPVEENSASV